MDASGLGGVIGRYGLARSGRDDGALLAIGRDLYRWLDDPERWLEALRAVLERPFVLEMRADLNPDAAGWALVHAPWELLADKLGFLAQDEMLRYVLVRRLGPRREALPPDEYRLGVAFMAAADRSGRPALLLEMDVWVVWALAKQFGARQ